MSAVHLGFFNTSGTRTHVGHLFSTHNSAGANVAPSSAIDAADIRVYRATDGAAPSATQRSSTSGFTVTSPFDSLTGFHALDIDLTDNSDSGFFAAGNRYWIVLAPDDETIDSQTITGVVLAYFEIGLRTVNTTQVAGTAQSTGDLNAKLDTIDDFIDTEVAAIKAKTDNLPSDPADASDIAASFSTVNTKLDTIDDFLDTEIAAIKAKTDNLPSDPADASDIAGSFTTINTKLDTIDDFLDTEIAAIKAKTDNLPSDPADASDVAASFSTVNATLATIAGYLDTEVAAILAAVDTEVAAIKTNTDKLGTAMELDGSVYRFTTNALEQAPTGGSAPTADENADALLARDIGSGTGAGTLEERTVRSALRAVRNRNDYANGVVYKEDDTTQAWTYTKTTDAAAEPVTGVDPA